MWKVGFSFGFAIVGAALTLASYGTPWLEWDVKITAVENVTPGYEVVLNQTRWSSRLGQEWDSDFARRNGLHIKEPNRICGEDLSATVKRYEQDISRERALARLIDTTIQIAGIVFAFATLHYFVALFHVFQKSRGDVFPVIGMTLLFCVAVVVVLALLGPKVISHPYCMIVSNDPVIVGNVTLQATMVGLRSDAIGYYLAGVAAIVLSSGVMLWQFLSWRRFTMAKTEVANAG